MKKTIKLTIFAALLAMTGSLSAQTLLNGGGKITLLNNKEDIEVYPGFYAGVTQTVELSRHVCLDLGVYYTRFSGKGYKEENGVKVNNFSRQEDAIAIPVPLKVRMWVSEVSYLYILGGVEALVGITSKGETWVNEGDPHVKTNYYDQGVPGELGRYNLNWMGGLGAKIDFLNLNLGITGNIFNRLYESDATQKAYTVFLGAGLAF